MESGMRVELDTFPNVLFPITPNRVVPRSSRTVFNFLFGSNIGETPVYQYLLRNSKEESCTVVFYRNQKQMGSLTVSRDVLSQGGLYNSLVLVVDKERIIHSCVFPIRLSPEIDTRNVKKYVALSLAEIFSYPAVEYIAEILLVFSGVTAFVFPAGLPSAAAAATSGAAVATAASGSVAAAMATIGIVIIGTSAANSVLKSVIGKQKAQHRYWFNRWLGTKWLPANAVGTYFGRNKIVKGVVLNEEMNHPTWGFGFIYVRSGKESTGICLSTDVFPQGEVTLRKFSAISDTTVLVFGSQNSYEFNGGKQKIASLFPLFVTFIDVRKSWENAMSNTTYSSGEERYT